MLFVDLFSDKSKIHFTKISIVYFNSEPTLELRCMANPSNTTNTTLRIAPCQPMIWNDVPKNLRSKIGRQHYVNFSPTYIKFYQSSTSKTTKTTLIARFMGPTLGLPGTDRTQVGPIWATWTLLPGNRVLPIERSTKTSIENIIRYGNQKSQHTNPYQCLCYKMTHSVSQVSLRWQSALASIGMISAKVLCCSIWRSVSPKRPNDILHHVIDIWFRLL